MEKTPNTSLLSYIDGLEITKVSFGKLFITDSFNRLVIEVSSKGKNAFANKGIFSRFNTNESELLTLIRNKFPDKAISSVFLM